MGIIMSDYICRRSDETLFGYKVDFLKAAFLHSSLQHIIDRSSIDETPTALTSGGDTMLVIMPLVPNILFDEKFDKKITVKEFINNKAIILGDENLSVRRYFISANEESAPVAMLIRPNDFREIKAHQEYSTFNFSKEPALV